MKTKIIKKKRGLALSERSESNGFTLFIAMVVTGTLLVVASGITNLAVKQAFISSSARESQHAFYAADTGIECAIFWDIKNPGVGRSAFSTSTNPMEISCNGDTMIVGGGPVSIFEFDFLPEDPYCAEVTVSKGTDGSTQIESKGYNTCDPLNARRVERAVRVTY